MNRIERASDEEILAAIIYLDPNFSDGWKRNENEGTETQSKHHGEILCIVLSIGMIVWVAALSYVPTMWEFLNQKLGPVLFR